MLPQKNLFFKCMNIYIGFCYNIVFSKWIGVQFFSNGPEYGVNWSLQWIYMNEHCILELKVRVIKFGNTKNLNCFSPIPQLSVNCGIRTHALRHHDVKAQDNKLQMWFELPSIRGTSGSPQHRQAVCGAEAQLTTKKSFRGRLIY